MAERISNIINSRYELLVNTAVALEKRIREFPEGSIKIKKTNYCSYFYLCIGEKELRHLTYDDSELIEQLIQKSYLKSALKAAKDEIRVIEKLKKNYPALTIEDVYDNLSDERKEYASPIIPGDAEFAAKWQAMAYTKSSLILRLSFTR